MPVAQPDVETTPTVPEQVLKEIPLDVNEDPKETEVASNLELP